MIDGKLVVGIIPARAGSKGLPGKNVLPLCGKPLIAWSIEAGKQSKYIDVIIVSTDSEQIAIISRSFGATVPFIRPANLATDDATTIDVVSHTLRYLETEFNQKFEYTVLLEPTSPIRRNDDIDRMLDKLHNSRTDFDAIISLGEAHNHPSLLKTINSQRVESFCEDQPTSTRRQDNTPVYFPFGIAYICKTTTLFAEKTFYPDRLTHFVIERDQCVEIDDEYDFLTAEAILSKRDKVQ